ncbi:acyl-CoA thioesterase [Legionella fairfieldensis]|uniref:acyl-CoA thioesterase n=1 Tax=Legionella fairfieldensis TaxID=45064 RepID=UPI00048EB7DE|nr:thioesterase family protein [Legionella fairfieldensis]
MKNTEFSWKSEVRAHEIDAQGIVNNAHYFCYFDHVRTLHIKSLGIDWVQLSQEGYDFVLVHADIRFFKSLRAFQTFKITSKLSQEGKLKALFYQRLFNDDKQLVCEGKNTIVCVDRTRNKPIAINQFISMS